MTRPNLLEMALLSMDVYEQQPSGPNDGGDVGRLSLETLEFIDHPGDQDVGEIGGVHSPMMAVRRETFG